MLEFAINNNKLCVLQYLLQNVIKHLSVPRVISITNIAERYYLNTSEWYTYNTHSTLSDLVCKGNYKVFKMFINADICDFTPFNTDVYIVNFLLFANKYRYIQYIAQYEKIKPKILETIILKWSREYWYDPDKEGMRNLLNMSCFSDKFLIKMFKCCILQDYDYMAEIFISSNIWERIYPKLIKKNIKLKTNRANIYYFLKCVDCNVELFQPYKLF